MPSLHFLFEFVALVLLELNALDSSSSLELELHCMRLKILSNQECHRHGWMATFSSEMDGQVLAITGDRVTDVPLYKPSDQWLGSHMAQQGR